MLKRFKNWLIHKLGGLTMEDACPYKVVQFDKPLEKLYAKVSVSKLANIPQEDIKKLLAQKFVDQLADNLDYRLLGQRSPYLEGYETYEATITLVGKKPI